MPYLYTLDTWWVALRPIALLALYFLTQGLYSLSLLVDGYIFSRPVNMVDMSERTDSLKARRRTIPRSSCSTRFWQSRNRSCARP